MSSQSVYIIQHYMEAYPVADTICFTLDSAYEPSEVSLLYEHALEKGRGEKPSAVQYAIEIVCQELGVEYAILRAEGVFDIDEYRKK